MFVGRPKPTEPFAPILNLSNYKKKKKKKKNYNSDPCRVLQRQRRVCDYATLVVIMTLTCSVHT
ncbi:hypothetical protein HanIR_Chr07g0335271 [Helianthus annuus]|nr:hypothetical protein HanIR_Chr07g0335271 [Helianthus annuus]